MLRFVHSKVWAFDLEWVPDPEAGRRVLGLPDGLPDAEVLAAMWQAGGATAQEPTPYLKTVLCRVVSLSMVARQVGKSGEVTVNLVTLPRDPTDPAQCGERHLVESFLSAVGKHKPQLVGFNSEAADFKILLQRALAHGIAAREFCARPDKPWEGVDYFARAGDWHVDLKNILGGFGRATPSLNELALVCGVPGKPAGVDGEQVPALWLAGQLPRIVAYNETDALSTYLVWLRLARLAGLLDSEEYAADCGRVEALLEARAAAGAQHLAEYLETWRRLRSRISTSIS